MAERGGFEPPRPFKIQEEEEEEFQARTYVRLRRKGTFAA